MIIKDKMGRVIGRTPGITYRKDDKDGN